MNKKLLATLGMVFSAVLVLAGILSLAGALGGDANYPSSAPYSYDSGYASFGADFYTYVSNNAGEAASASRTAANNIRELCELVKNVCGCFLMGFGLLGFCHFGIVFCECPKKETVENAPAESEAPAEPEAPAAPEAPAE